MSDLVSNIVSFFGGAGIIILMAIWALKSPEKIETIVAWFYRTFNWVSKKWEYNTVATDVQNKVNTYGEKLIREAPGVLPHAMKIDWSKDSQSVEASLRRGEIVVTLDFSHNRDRNLVVATLAYLAKGLLPWARTYVDQTLIRAVDFTVAKNIFASSKQNLATQYFFENFLRPGVQENPQLQEDCTALDLIHDRGLFTRVFLRQLHVMGEKVFPATPDAALQNETRDFKNFLHQIASKQRGVNVPGGLTFAGSKIRASVMLVAKEETLVYGLTPYLRRTSICRSRGVEYLYICGIGADNISLAEHIAKVEEAAGVLRVLDVLKYRLSLQGRDYNSVCIICALNLIIPSRATSEVVNEVYNVLEEHIDEIADGQVEVMAIARKQGVRSKIAVRSLAEGIDAVAICTKQEMLTAMQFALAGEQLEFVKWSYEPESMIISSLYPLKRDQVLELVVNTDLKEATVKVDGWKARRNAIGRGNQNLELAMDLTEWKITVEDASGGAQEKEEQD